MDVVGVDVGGTFTDIVVFDGSKISQRKAPTSDDQSESVASAVRGESSDTFLHGATVATNALLEGRGASVALITDTGCEDIIEIARQDRPSLYDSAVDRPAPLVGRSMRFGNSADVVASVAASRPEAVAISLIGSFEDGSNERELKRRLGEAGLGPVVISSDVSPEFREYERTATTALSAYLTPLVAGYLSNLDGILPMDTRLVMTSAGGLVPFSDAVDLAGRLVLSGPAGGAVASEALGRHHGCETVLTFDMGGTSTDVSRISHGGLTVGAGHMIAGRVNRVPSVPIRTIGAGGGSIAWRDQGGALRVGPRSAGANPGPAAYRRGGAVPTVTDANLIAGHIPASLALGGTVELDLEAAHAAAKQLGHELGLTVEETAAGILEVVDSHMEHALRSVSVEEGADPREAVLVAFGGAGGLHAAKLARRLGVGTVLIPPLAGVFSALGLMLAKPRADRSKTVMRQDGDPRLAADQAGTRASAAEAFRSMFGMIQTSLSVSVDVRYRGQSHELEVPGGSWEEIRASIEKAHRQRFGFARPNEPVEAVNVRAAAVGEAPVKWSDLPAADRERTPVRRDGVWVRGSLPAGWELAGPALVADANSSVLLTEGDQMRVADDGTLVISVE